MACENLSNDYPIVMKFSVCLLLTSTVGGRGKATVRTTHRTDVRTRALLILDRIRQPV